MNYVLQYVNGHAVLNLLLLNIASSCEKVLMTLKATCMTLKATCICVQTGQKLLYKSTFSCGMAK